MQDGKAQASHVVGFAAAGHLAQLVRDQATDGFKILIGIARLQCDAKAVGHARDGGVARDAPAFAVSQGVNVTGVVVFIEFYGLNNFRILAREIK